MAYVALYRKWRPQDFSALIGQDHIKTALCNALTSNRVAHAYLFAGPRGTGKTSAAKILAKAVNCLQGPTPMPCNVCENCQRINNGSSMDVFEIDAASNRGIDEIRELREKVRFSPVEGKRRVYIIDEVHMLTTEAFNALLKTLEEPPAHVLFILATTEPHKIPATIHSRCQRYDFRRMGSEDTVSRLREVAAGSDLTVDDDALLLIAAQADGGMRDALSLLDQCSVMADKVISAEIVRSLFGIIGREKLRELVLAIGQQQECKVLELLEELLASGKDIRQVIAELAAYFRAVMLFKAAPGFNDIYITDDKDNLAKVADLFVQGQLVAASRRLHEASLELRVSLQPRIAAEVCLLELCRLSSESADLLARVQRLESLLAGAGQIADRAVEVKAAVQKPKMAVPEEPPVVKVPEQAVVKPEISMPAVVPDVPKEDVVLARSAAEPVKDEPGVVMAVDGDLWEKTLSKLLAERKRSLHACLGQGRLAVLAGGVARIEFASDFPCQRMQKEDYRLVVEKVMSELTGQAVSVECTTVSAKSEVAEKKAQAPAVKEKEELPEAVRQALAVFGGEVYKIKNNGG